MSEQKQITPEEYAKLREDLNSKLLKQVADLAVEALNDNLKGDTYAYTQNGEVYSFSIVKQKKNEAGDIINTPTKISLSIYNQGGIKATCSAEIPMQEAEVALEYAGKLCGLSIIVVDKKMYVKGDVRIGEQTIELMDYMRYEHKYAEMVYDVQQHVPELVHAVGLTAGMFNNM